MCGGLTVRFRPSTLGSTFFLFFFLIPVSLFVGFLSLQMIVNMWQCFYLFLKPVLKVMYTVSQLMSDTSFEH